MKPNQKCGVPYSPQLWGGKWDHYCTSTRMDLAVNNPQRLIYHKTQKN